MLVDGAEFLEFVVFCGSVEFGQEFRVEWGREVKNRFTFCKAWKREVYPRSLAC